MRRTLILVLLLLLAFAVTLGVMRLRAARAGPTLSPAIVSFTATPRSIRRGESVTVSWKTRDVGSVALEWGPALHPRDNLQRRTGLPPSGTMTDQPNENTIYVLECENSPGQVCASASTTLLVK